MRPDLLLDDPVLVRAIARDEGRKLAPYDDATGRELRPGDALVGNLTVGVGWNLTANGLPPDVVDDLYRRARLAAIARASGFAWFPSLDDARQRAVVNLCYNLGGRILGFRRFLAAMADGRHADAAAELRGSLWSGQVGDGPGGADDRADRIIAAIAEGKD